MNCPRCKGRMHTAQDEMRINQGDVAELKAAECVKCVNCGNRVYREQEVALPMSSNMKLPKQPYMQNVKPGRKPSHGELMKKYFTSIRKLRKGNNPASWDAIAKLIKTAENVPIVGRTVQQYYEDLLAKGHRP